MKEERERERGGGGREEGREGRREGGRKREGERLEVF